MPSNQEAHLGKAKYEILIYFAIPTSLAWTPLELWRAFLFSITEATMYQVVFSVTFAAVDGSAKKGGSVRGDGIDSLPILIRPRLAEAMI